MDHCVDVLGKVHAFVYKGKSIGIHLPRQPPLSHLQRTFRHFFLA